jgi:hypothetical protein
MPSSLGRLQGVQCWPTSRSFTSEADLQSQTIAANPGGCISQPQHQAMVTKKNQTVPVSVARFPDLYDTTLDMVLELKVGRWSNRSYVHQEVQADEYLVTHNIVLFAEWDFFPSSAGNGISATGPSGPLAQMLSAASAATQGRIQVNIFIQNWHFANQQILFTPPSPFPQHDVLQSTSSEGNPEPAPLRELSNEPIPSAPEPVGAPA